MTTITPFPAVRHLLVATFALAAFGLAGCPDEDDPTPTPTTDVSADATIDGTGDGATNPDGVGPDAVTDAPQGDAPMGDAPQGDAPMGDAPQGDAPMGDIPTGDAPMGDVPTGDTGGDTEPLDACETPIAPAASGTCDITPGDDNKLLLEGDLVLSTGILPAGRVLVVDGVITCVGCDCGTAPDAATATKISCAEGVISPGLINAHDHITWAQDTPKDPGNVRYDHRHEWRKGLNGKPKITTYQNSNALGDAWGEMRQVLGGTTSLFGSGGEGGFLRNLDRGNLLEGLNHPDGDYSTFPMGDSSGSLYTNGCGGYNPDDPLQASNESAYVPHVAEGIIEAARNEFVCMSGDGNVSGVVDFTNDNAAFIHGIGVTTSDIGLMASEGTSLIWSPRSNTALYGVTANAQIYHRLGALIAVGTDWTPSGSIHVLRELACAENWNAYWDYPFTDADLVAMATFNAAEALGFSEVLGSLTPGKVADITIWNGSANLGYRAILDAESSDVVMVMRGGLPLYGDADLIEATTVSGDCETLDVCGTDKRICTQREIGTTIPVLEPDLGQFNYDLIFCGPPQDEPSCHPFRPDEFDGNPTATDSDGDGIPDTEDNCELVFNPIRPIDGGTQNDADNDGEGDECDPCPFDPNTTACSSVDPLDIDGDTIPIPADNCPSIQNTNQEDADGDGIGDVCDACPNFSNPGGGACPGTIYDVKTGTIGLGGGVFLPGVIVTAVGYNFFAVQVDPSDAGYTGPENSGVYVYYPQADPDEPQVTYPVVGDKIDLTGVVNDFYGQTQLIGNIWTLVEAGVGAPAPLAIAPSELITGTGANASDYEGVLVTVTEVTVTNINPTGQGSETVENEFEVAGGLPVDDQLYLMDPFPQADQVIPAITGLVRYNWNRNKLLPRSAADLSLGPPYLLSFGPDAVVYDQQTNVMTIPAIEVRLNTTPSAPLFVAVTSDDAGLTVVGGGVTIGAGELSGVVMVTTTAPAAAATLTATLDDVTLQATVQVIDVNQTPEVATLELASATAGAGADIEATVTLDIPAPPGDQVVQISSTGVALTVPSTVTVPAGTTSTTFTVTTGNEFGTATVSAVVGAGVPVDAPIEVTDVPPVGLLLVEIFYDAQSTQDTQHEWVKLYNGTGSAIDLSGYSLGYGGGSYDNATKQLTGTVQPGECFIVGGPLTDAFSFNAAFDQAEDFSPDIQNSGTNADGVGLFNLPEGSITGSSIPIDAVVYGGSNGDGFIGPDGQPFAQPHVGDSGPEKSIIRTGLDTWAIHDTPDSLGCITVQ